ncbi:MAG: sulfatase-like hydrolase/transferase, partial [bacterium]|nr:sulfatase-like hydrolase/transferase [bacterium]
KEIGASSSEGWTRIQGAFWRAGGVASGFQHEEVLPKLEQEAVSVISNHVRSDSGKPLFLYVALPAPHTPWLPLDRFQGKSRVGMYGDFVMQVDYTVGQILDALDRTQLSGNTLVIFTSDNGPVWYEQDVQRYSHDAAGPLRGMKGDAWEGGHRVPFLARWPGRIRPGSASNQLLCFTDMMATFAAIVGSAPPETAIDSHNMLSALLGRDSRPIRDNLVLKQAATVVRQGDWKLITHLGSGGFSDPRRVSPVPGGPQGQLY